MERARKFARQHSITVLINGESGTGKTLLARFLHDNSPRADRPFRPLDLASIDDNLAGSELFGHFVGAFTDARTARKGAFIAADTGTLFLDEIGKASVAVQKKLLTALESGEVVPLGSDHAVRIDVRLIAATNVALNDLRDSGRMLADLIPRLGAFVLSIPPLRERKEDIPSLATAMIERHSYILGRTNVPSVHADLMHALKRADWPNNLRELDSAIQRIVVDAEGSDVLTVDHCNDSLEYLRALSGRARQVTSMQVVAVASSASTRSIAAEKLGVSQATLYRRLKQAEHSRIQLPDIRATESSIEST